MRICLVSNLYPPNVIGGAEVMVGHIARGLQATGHEVTVITTAPRRRSRAETLDGIRVHWLRPGNLYWAGHAPRMSVPLKVVWHAVDLWNPVVYRQVRPLLAGEKFDVMHSHNLGGLSPAVWSAAVAAGLPVVHTTHDYALTCVRAMRFRRSGQICERPCGGCAARGAWLRRVSAGVRIVAAPSRFVLERHLELGFFRNASHAIVPLGLPATSAPGPAARRDGPLRVLYLGQLRAHKGVRVLLEAFARQPELDARLDIAGAGELSAECAKAAASDARIRLHGFVQGVDKQRLLGSSHVLAVPSIWWDVSPLVMVEALSSGLPIIGSRIGGIPETVEDGVTGFLVEPGDAEALGARVASLARDRALVESLSAQCRVRAASFTVERTVRRLLEVYERAQSTAPVGP